MIKFSTVAAFIVTAAVIVYSVPNVREIMSAQDARESIGRKQKVVSEQLSGVGNELGKYAEKYSDISILSNLDMAETVASLKGCQFRSAVSIAEVNGGMVECAEVTEISDVSFFSSSTVRIKFKLILQDLEKFIQDIGNSLIPVEILEINADKKEISLTVHAVFGENEMEVADE